MDLSIIIVSWNVKDKLQANLAALFKSGSDFSFEVFVVDNASADGSADMVREQFPQVKLICNGENIGFSRANNLALQQAAGRYLLLLNPDMLVEEDTLVKCLDWMEKNQNATVAGCRLVDEKGRIVRQVRRFPRLWDQLLVTLKMPHVLPFLINGYRAAAFDYSKEARVDSIRGAFFLINRENFKRLSDGIEPRLDERFFIWFEEVDFCRQVYELGGEVWYSPVASCRDYVAASFKQVPRGQGQEYFRDSMLKYFEKWGKKWEYRVLKAAWKIIRIFI